MDTFALILNNLVKHYRSVPALNGLDLSVKKGELLCLVGPSGSGKTTAMHVIAGLIELDSGDITLFGQSLAGVAPKDRDVAMVFQDGALYPHLTVQQNLAFPLWARDKKGSKAVPNMARRLEIEHLLDRYPSQISGGEARRVALGRVDCRWTEYAASTLRQSPPICTQQGTLAASATAAAFLLWGADPPRFT